MTGLFLKKPDSKKEKRKRDSERTASRSKFRKDVIAAAGGLCERRGCGLKATSAHHIILKSHGGLDDITNGIALCAVDHHFVHNGTGLRGDHTAKEWMLQVS